jgi:hypothetical protein
MRFRRVMRDRFYQFSWRPRPPSLLSEADLKEIARNLRKYSEKYAKEDDVLMAQVRLLLQGGPSTHKCCQSARPQRPMGSRVNAEQAGMQQDVEACRA